MKENPSVTTHSYLSFRIGNEVFAAHVQYVIKIMEMAKITKIPHTPAFIKGIINLSGGVLPVVDGRTKLGFEESPYTAFSSIIVLEITNNSHTEQVGVIVDAALKVMEIEDSAIKSPPAFGKKYEVAYISGILPQEKGFIILLDIPEFFSYDEISTLSSLTES